MTARATEPETAAAVSSIKDELTRVEAEEPQSSAASRRALVRLEERTGDRVDPVATVGGGDGDR